MSFTASLTRPARAATITLIAALGLLAALAPASADAAGAGRYQAYYNVFDRGDALIPGHDTRWVPQGLTYWPERDALIISYYDGEEELNSRLAVIDRKSGKQQKIFELPVKSHVGGLAMSRGYVWVAGEGAVTRYAKRTLELTSFRLADSGRIPTRASSYLTINHNKLWVGDFDKDIAYRYTIGRKNENLRDDRKSIRTPGEVQGMAIAKGKVIWSRSYGRDNDSRIEMAPLSSPTPHGGRAFRAPNMSEGIVLARGELHVLYESGSSIYDDADYRVRTVHHAPIGRVLG